MQTQFTAAFVGFQRVITCKTCNESIGIDNIVTQKDMDKQIRSFRNQHIKAHEEVEDGSQ